MTQAAKSLKPNLFPALPRVVSTTVVLLVCGAGAWIIAFSLPRGQEPWWWVFIGTSLLLIVAIIGLRYVDPSKMSLLKKCVIVSVLLHILIALCFSAVVVTREVVKMIRREEPMTPAVNLQLSREMEVREQVRQQVQDLPAIYQAPALTPQQVNSPLPEVTPKLQPVGTPGLDLHQLSALRNPVAPTVPSAPTASNLTTPLLPVNPTLKPINESTPLPSPLVDVARPASHLSGALNEQLAKATTPLPGSGLGVLRAPPASLPRGESSGGSATGSGTGKPFSLWNGSAPPPLPTVAPILPPAPPPAAPELAHNTPNNNDGIPQRGFEQRQKALQKYGGTNETEAAVARALLYLSRTQHVDGHWSKFINTPAENASDSHDTALTALAVLCYLAADHTPDKPGPYQENVRRGISYLMAVEQANGDLRGEGNMYDQGIGTLALGEAASMTRDRRMRDAAHRAAIFIIDAQNGHGGWRYSPKDLFTDTSVTGWQVLAMHSARRTGFVVPDQVKRNAVGFLDSITGGDHGGLAGYLTKSPSPSMTAEAIFTRMLLGQNLSEARVNEAGNYLVTRMPERDGLNYYFIYYGSLALMQMQGDDWQKWNAHTSKLLLALQERKGAAVGSWAPEDSEWGTRGGRIYTTTLATLSLEVYYRYLPMYGQTRPK